MTLATRAPIAGTELNLEAFAHPPPRAVQSNNQLAWLEKAPDDCAVEAAPVELGKIKFFAQLAQCVAATDTFVASAWVCVGTRRQKLGRHRDVRHKQGPCRLEQRRWLWPACSAAPVRRHQLQEASLVELLRFGWLVIHLVSKNPGKTHRHAGHEAAAARLLVSFVAVPLARSQLESVDLARYRYRALLCLGEPSCLLLGLLTRLHMGFEERAIDCRQPHNGVEVCMLSKTLPEVWWQLDQPVGLG